MGKEIPTLEGSQRDFYRRMLGQAETLDFVRQENRMTVYSDGYVARLTEALATGYPAVKRTLGDEAFFSIARTYVSQHPSKHYSLDGYGEHFSTFLQNLPLQEFPWIVDLAKLEKNVLTSFHAFDRPIMIRDQLSTIHDADFGHLRFYFQDSFILQASSWPIKMVWSSLLENPSSAVFPRQPSFVMLYRQEDQVYIRDVVEKEYRLLLLLKHGSTLECALEEADVESPDDIFADFNRWMSFGIIHSLGVTNDRP